jgi:hypothetical protein
MLQAVEIVPSSRKNVRRAVEIGCELVSQSSMHIERMFDLSPQGARVHSRAQLHRGDDVLLTFVPPNAPRRVSALGRVQHQSNGIVGVKFDALERIDEDALGFHLRGLPPPLPKQRRVQREMVWVDALLTYEEDLGDRIHIYEVSERVGSFEDELDIAPLAPMLTGSRRYRWRSR